MHLMPWAIFFCLRKECERKSTIVELYLIMENGAYRQDFCRGKKTNLQQTAVDALDKN